MVDGNQLYGVTYQSCITTYLQYLGIVITVHYIHSTPYEYFHGHFHIAHGPCSSIVPKIGEAHSSES